MALGSSTIVSGITAVTGVDTGIAVSVDDDPEIMLSGSSEKFEPYDVSRARSSSLAPTADAALALLGRVCLLERGPAGPSLGRSRRAGESNKDGPGSSMAVCDDYKDFARIIR